LLIPLAMGLLDPDGAPLPLKLSGETDAPKERVLWLRDFAERYVFEDIPAPPVPSLLRGFSAPVRLEFPYTDEELAFLVAHDPDAFNRWNAAETLIVRIVKAAAAKPDTDYSPPPGVLIDAWRTLLVDETLDPALVAETLSLPTETELAQAFERVDVEALHAVRSNLKRGLAAALEAEFLTALERSAPREPYRYDPPEAGRRRLYAVALDYLGALETAAHLARVEAAFDSADNMSDRLAALAVLAFHVAPERTRALGHFRTRYADQPLVLDKWFALQASAPLPGALERVRALMDDPVFTLANPNRVRALIGAFAHNNHAGFHARSLA
jgi:aminopeptidase N